MHLVGCFFTKSQGADFPFFGNRERDSKESQLCTCRPVLGKNVAEVIRLRYSMIYILLKIHAYNGWASISEYINTVRVHIILVCVHVQIIFFQDS